MRADPADLIAPVVSRSKLIAVVTVRTPAHGPSIARALAEGGVGSIEITLRTPAGLEAIRRAVAEAPQALVGAGTCLTVEDLEAAKAAGAGFAVSPGLRPELLDAARELGLPYLAGVATASEVMLGLAHGYSTFKFFPATQAGGVAYLNALRGPFPTVRFCPTGGVTPETAATFLSLANVPCLGGSWLAPQSVVEAEDWAAIRSRARAFVEADAVLAAKTVDWRASRLREARGEPG